LYGPIAIGQYKKLVFIDPLRINFAPTCLSEFQSNITYVFSLLHALEIPVIFEVDDWLTYNNNDFLMLQLSYIYDSLQFRQGCVLSASISGISLTGMSTTSSIIAAVATTNDDNNGNNDNLTSALYVTTTDVVDELNNQRTQEPSFYGSYGQHGNNNNIYSINNNNNNNNYISNNLNNNENSYMGQSVDINLSIERLIVKLELLESQKAKELQELSDKETLLIQQFHHICNNNDDNNDNSNNNDNNNDNSNNNNNNTGNNNNNYHHHQPTTIKSTTTTHTSSSPYRSTAIYTKEQLEHLEQEYVILLQYRSVLQDHFVSRAESLKNEIKELLNRVSTVRGQRGGSTNNTNNNNYYSNDDVMMDIGSRSRMNNLMNSTNLSIFNNYNTTATTTTTTFNNNNLGTVSSSTSFQSRDINRSFLQHKSPWISPIVKATTPNTIYKHLLQYNNSMQSQTQTQVTMTC
jgi:hypothetical protein